MMVAARFTGVDGGCMICWCCGCLYGCTGVGGDSMFRSEFHLVPLNKFQSNIQRGTTLEVVRLISSWRASVHLRDAQPELHQIS
jgi:hypothetical protein